MRCFLLLLLLCQEEPRSLATRTQLARPLAYYTDRSRACYHHVLTVGMQTYQNNYKRRATTGMRTTMSPFPFSLAQEKPLPVKLHVHAGSTADGTVSLEETPGEKVAQLVVNAQG